MEIPSSTAGVVKEMRVALGDKIKQGSVVLVVEAAVAAVVAPAVATPSSATASQAQSSMDRFVPRDDKAAVPRDDKAAANPTSVIASEARQSTAPPNPTSVIASEARQSTAPPNPTSVIASEARQSTAPPVVHAAGPVEVHVPDIGDFKDVVVIEVMVKPGDSIKVEQSLITVESDKASMEIPSSHAGVLQELKVKVGDTVNIGDLLAVLAGTASAAAPVAAAVAAPVAVASAASSPSTVMVSEAKPSIPESSPGANAPRSDSPAHAPGGTTLGLPHASPSVRKFARELGVPLAEVKGSGLKGRITEADVQAFTQAVMSGAAQTKAQAAKAPAVSGGGGSELGLIPWPKVDFAKFGPIERKEMGRIKKISGANLLRNAIMIPAVTNHDDADITDLEAFRVSTNKENEKSGVKVTMLAFLIKACVAALKKYPEFNSSLDGDAIVYKNYWHIGFAADTPNGLMVPVIRDCDKKGVLQISAEMSELAKKARDGKLSPAEMTGATFTISSLGGIGGKYFTPIINAPEVAILGVCKSTMEPVWDGKAFQPRLMLPLSLTWDHRVIDGAAAARFNAFLGQILSDFRRVLL
jgi:pyruvate dehydrogenase E2 component (dihydrolipoamide acetyltransferase)